MVDILKITYPPDVKPYLKHIKGLLPRPEYLLDDKKMRKRVIRNTKIKILYRIEDNGFQRIMDDENHTVLPAKENNKLATDRQDHSLSSKLLGGFTNEAWVKINFHP